MPGNALTKKSESLDWVSMLLKWLAKMGISNTWKRHWRGLFHNWSSPTLLSTIVLIWIHIVKSLSIIITNHHQSFNHQTIINHSFTKQKKIPTTKNTTSADTWGVWFSARFANRGTPASDVDPPELSSKPGDGPEWTKGLQPTSNQLSRYHWSVATTVIVS